MADRSELLENYYEELDPDKRRSLLDQYLSGSAPDDPVDRYRSALYDYRYTNPKEPGRKVDNYMWALLSLMYTHRESLIFPGRNVKAVRRIMKDLAQDERVHTDERFAEAFTQEVRNAVRRYFDTCKSDNYHKKLFGVTHSTADEKEKQRCIDTWKMSVGVARRVGIEDEMSLFNQAVAEEYRLSRPDGMTLEEAYSNYKKK